MMTRREALKTTVLATTACATAALPTFAQQAGGQFTLPPLPYPADALEPHIDARTMEIHHDKHHAGYVNNLNKALAGAGAAASKPIEQILRNLESLPESIKTAVRNNGGGHYNHTLFWQLMKKGGGGEPRGELAKAIDSSFGSFGSFKEKFTEAATKVFGSGWAWLVFDGKQLKIQGTPNQDVPFLGLQSPNDNKLAYPLLGLDVWEHAYYLKYQNRRPEYINAWFNVVNWDFVSDRYAKAGRA